METHAGTDISAAANSTAIDSWPKVENRLRVEVGEDIFLSWFASVQCESLVDGVVRLSVAIPFLQRWLQKHYAEKILACWNTEQPDIERVEIVVRTPQAHPSVRDTARAIGTQTPVKKKIEVSDFSVLNRTNGFDVNPTVDVSVDQSAGADEAEEASQGAVPEGPKRIWIEDILHVVSKHYGVSRVDLLSARRTKNVVRPRQIAMYIAKTLTLRSLPEIGRRFGGRDHTTVLHAVRKIEGLVRADQTLAAEVELLKKQVLSHKS